MCGDGGEGGGGSKRCDQSWREGVGGTETAGSGRKDGGPGRGSCPSSSRGTGGDDANSNVTTTTAATKTTGRGARRTGKVAPGMCSWLTTV